VNSLLWIVLALFVLALSAGLIRKLSKDPCLKFFEGSHVSYLGRDGVALWGSMHLTSQGLHLWFDASHVDERALTESGAILFISEVSTMVALCRCVHGMGADEERRRDKQVRAVLYPSRLTRFRRKGAMIGGIARDAVIDTTGLVVGQLKARSKPVVGLGDRPKQVTDFGGALLDLAARAYEPLLERLIGEPILVRIEVPGLDGKPRSVHFPGYLADYNEKYLVVVADSQQPEEAIALTSDVPEIVGVAAMELRDRFLTLRCTGEDAVVVKRIVGRDHALDLAAALLPGCRLTVLLPSGFDLRRLEADRTRRLDYVCPRATSVVRYSSAAPPMHRDPWRGVGPA
jgi:hypothetical protein